MHPTRVSQFNSTRLFGLFCLGGYLLSIAYGVTFLLPLLVGLRGGNEGNAGLIISAATVSTVLFVIFSGHSSDQLGTAFSVSVAALFLGASGFGFALSESAGWVLLLYTDMGVFTPHKTSTI